MRIFYEIELFKIVGRNWIKSIGLWHICCLFAGLKISGNLLYRGAAEYFLKNQNCLFFYVNLCRYLGKNQLHIVSTRSLLVLLTAIIITTSH